MTTPIAVSLRAGLDAPRQHRARPVGRRQRALAPDNPFKDFVPNGGAVTTSKLIAATENCAGCHVRFAEHGGPRRNVEYCAVCHNPATIDPDSGESVDLAYMAHSIHRGEDRAAPYIVFGFNGEEFDTGEVTYPQPASFCETCHTATAATPQGDDWKSRPERGRLRRLSRRGPEQDGSECDDGPVHVHVHASVGPCRRTS